MKVHVKGQGPVTLNPNQFVALGGQASVYVKDGTAYKIYTDPKTAVPDAKFMQLAAIQDPCVIKPESLLLNDKNDAIGYTMRAVKDNYSLCQFFTQTFRDRVKATNDTILTLAEKLQEHISNVHQAGILIVDLNELNILVPHSIDDTYLIDVDSFQTPGYPATVIMPSVRDYSVKAKDFSPLSDWYSYAILSFQLFIGAHPYKGTHPGSSSIPKGDQLEHRMKNNISAFRPDVRLPKCCHPFDVIPQGFRDWLKAVLEDGKRVRPPSLLGAPVVVFTPVFTPFLVASGNLLITEVLDLKGWHMLSYDEANSSVLMLSVDSKNETSQVSYGARILEQRVARPGVTMSGYTPKLNRPVGLNLHNGVVTFIDYESKTEEKMHFQATEIAKSGDRFYLRYEGQVMEVEFFENTAKTIVTVRGVANVMENASRLYEGCVIQSMIGSIFVSLFPKSAAGYQVRIPELDGCKIIDAKFDGGVLMVVRARDGVYDRLVFRFDDSFATYDLREVKDITPSGLNFITLASGVCVSITEDEKIEVFLSKKGAQGAKVVDDPVIGNDMRLLKVNGRAGFERAGKIYQMSLK